MALNKQLAYRGAVSFILIVTLICLLSGADFLVWRVKILFNFHVATILAWFGLVSISLLSISINRNNRKLTFFSSTSFYVSIFWLLISYLLAGNNNLNFSEARIFSFYIWLLVSSLPIIVILVSFFYNTSWKLIKSIKKRT